MKACTHCGELKPPEGFEFHNPKKGTRRSVCRPCYLVDRAKYRDRNRKYLRESANEYYYRDTVATKLRARRNSLNARETQAPKLKAYLKTERCILAKKRGYDNWVKSNPEKMEAYKVTHKAIRDGLIVRAPCEVCDNLKAEAHHDDYLKPLEVRWLCSKHHAEHHRLERLEILTSKQKNISEAMG